MRTERVIELIRASDPLAAAPHPAVASDEAFLDRVMAAPRPAPGGGRRRRLRISAVVAATCAIAVPAVAFADQIGSLVGLYDHGTPVPASAFPNPWAAAIVRDPGFGNGEVRQVGAASGVSFYAAKNAAGDYCLGVGFAATPSIDALTCGPAVDSFVSGAFPIEDFSSLDGSGSTMSVTRLAGYANSQAVRVAVVGPDGNTFYSTPVVNGLYASSDVPPQAATAIVAFDSANNVIYRRALIPPPAPQPAVP